VDDRAQGDLKTSSPIPVRVQEGDTLFSGRRRHWYDFGACERYVETTKQADGAREISWEWRFNPMYIIIDNYDSFTYNLLPVTSPN